MKGLGFCLSVFLLVLTASCTKSGPSDSLSLGEGVKQIVFFSNDTDYTEEASYYDALLELKKEFPVEVDNMMVFSEDSAKSYYHAFHIEQSPAIVIVYNDKVVAQVKGDVSKEQIIQPLEQVLSQ
ncbi:small peptidoglycan-associated lipoprotein [Bacillus canaveralius]|uniref:Small peptidoglycan-associated lipoprotein n=1 Tax=Bacillus canaveralius TaxID=1403243 RepID=A0A2N5GNI3_9BACI|nr:MULTISPECIES: small peptidoglycan-associated lipoprotein [Bacillus]PLR84051.1 small peptidoglycan-associated lipoprotein [Bacillus canaveralius]PLR87284.1 small peptidoglycan-associated lipoprotein [Bacillus sp. V33-4]PLR96303.1 small peptidoglycan-associated lipoprotein [Bacillus canaveralius]